MLEAKTKKDIISDFQTSDKDTGSPEVQIALLTSRIEQLNNHFKTNKQDFSSHRGLIILVGKRRRLLRYLKSNNAEKYREILKRLGLRK